jgi:two-component system, NtrC family, response regulator GlrR
MGDGRWAMGRWSRSGGVWRKGSLGLILTRHEELRDKRAAEGLHCEVVPRSLVDRSEDRTSTEETEPFLRGEPTAPVPLGVIIRVLDAPATPPSFRLAAGTCVVGGAPSCDVVIAVPTVSRAHVELGLVQEGVSVRDLGSRNGTFFHGQRVEKMVLSLGGRITVGSVTITIEADAASLDNAPAFSGSSYRGIVGTSPALRRLFAVLQRLEGSLATVLIDGESGVGKERVAHALHEGSSASGGPLVVVNCGAIPRELIGSELFGHRRGAFSGAIDSRKGAFETADRGTLFLDEIGELPLDLQPMLLRAIELGEVRALGDDQTKRVKVRVIAATNRDLEAEARAGKFRQDLFYRLAVVRLRVPPLRERPEDIVPLATRFALSAGLPGLDPEVIAELTRRRWPGNARQLQNAILSYAALGALPDTPGVEVPDLQRTLTAMVDPRRPYAEQKDALTDAFTRVYLQALMAQSGGNQSEAARVAGLNRNYLARMLAKYGLAKGSAADGGEGSE